MARQRCVANQLLQVVRDQCLTELTSFPSHFRLLVIMFVYLLDLYPVFLCELTVYSLKQSGIRLSNDPFLPHELVSFSDLLMRFFSSLTWSQQEIGEQHPGEGFFFLAVPWVVEFSTKRDQIGPLMAHVQDLFKHSTD